MKEDKFSSDSTFILVIVAYLLLQWCKHLFWVKSDGMAIAFVVENDRKMLLLVIFKHVIWGSGKN